MPDFAEEGRWLEQAGAQNLMNEILKKNTCDSGGGISFIAGIIPIGQQVPRFEQISKNEITGLFEK